MNSHFCTLPFITLYCPQDQDILTSLQMDMSEFQSEICGLESKKQLENRKEEMDKVKQGVKEETSTPNSIIIVSLF